MSQSIKVYTPQGNLRKLFTCTDAEVAVVGPRGTGKTLAVLTLAYMRAINFPGSKQLFIRSTKKDLASSVLDPFEKEVCTKDDRDFWGGKTSQHRDVYLFENGSQIYCGGCDDTSRFNSTNIDCTYIFEGTVGITESDYDKLNLITRSNTMGFRQVLSDMNPSHPQHFYKRRIDSGLITEIKSTHKDNPTYYDIKSKSFTKLGKEYIAKLDRLPPVQRARFLLGEWWGHEGLVYPEFDNKNLVDGFIVPDNYKRFRCIDYGYTHPFVCLWCAVSPENIVYVYRQWYMTNMILEKHIEKIKELSGSEAYAFTVADSADKDAIMTMNAKGMFVKGAKKIGIEKQVDAVKTRLLNNQLKVMRNSLVKADHRLSKIHKPVCLQDEFIRYEYMPVKDGQIEETPKDEDNHALDCLSYGIVSLDGGSSTCQIINLKDLPVEIINSESEVIDTNIFNKDNYLSVWNDKLFREC